MIKKFLTCGVVGWCLEIIFTAACTMKKHDIRLKGNTSLWMFPIYGMAVLLQPLSRLYLCHRIYNGQAAPKEACLPVGLFGGSAQY